MNYQLPDILRKAYTEFVVPATKKCIEVSGKIPSSVASSVSSSVTSCVTRSRTKYRKFKSLVKIVKETHPSDGQVKNVYNAAKLVVKKDFETWMQTHLGLTKDLTNKITYYTYYYNYKPYRIIVNHHNGPTNTYQIFGEKGEREIVEISPLVEQYMGPCHDFHNCEISPNLLGYSKISFINVETGDISSFSGDEIMRVVE